MKKYYVLVIAIFLLAVSCFAQVGINNDNSAPDPSAMLDVKSSDKGFLPPRMTTAQRDLIGTPQPGLIIFNTDCDEFQYYKSIGWKTLSGSGQIASPGAINGSTNLCAQAAGVLYSCEPVQDATSYTWSVPAGATIVSGQGTQSIIVNYSVSGGSICVTANNACYNSLPACVSVIVSASVIASVSISTVSTTVCQGTLVEFTTTAVNGGSVPQFQWKKNNIDIPGATGSTYSYIPEHNDKISCRMVSNATCVAVPNVYSNNITMTVFSSIPGSPAEGTHVVSLTDITWKWNSVSNATGYKWNTVDNYANATDMGDLTQKLETGLTCNTPYDRYVWAYNSCGASAPVLLTASTSNGPVASVSIGASANPVCSGTSVTFTATPVNGGTVPLYQWRVNGTNVAGATSSTYTYAPANGDSVRCRMTSGATCAQNNPAWSNMVTMTVNSVPDAPLAGTHVASLTEITWNWNTVSNATGYKWNTTSDYATATDMGTMTTKTEPTLNCGTAYTRYVWAYNGCGHSTPLTMSQSTLACPFVCGTVLTINHVTTGGVAPVNKTTTYGTVTNIPGETAKCWITSNLGSTQQATSVSDATEASAGWYWQFNRKKGYKHDGSTLTPAWTITSITESSDWLTTNDPCNLELGAAWRLPTYTEWYNVDNTGGWTNWSGPWGSGLKLHAAGCLDYSNGALGTRGSNGNYWSSTQNSTVYGWGLNFGSGGSSMYNGGYKAYGFSARCLRDN